MTKLNRGYTETVRTYARANYIEPARKRGDKRVRIVSGDIYRALKVRNVVPSVCDALRSKKFLKENALALYKVQGPPSGQSTTVVFEYRLIEEPKETASTDLSHRAAFHALRGIFKDAFAAVGGGEAWLKNERAHFYKAGDPRADPETGN